MIITQLKPFEEILKNIKDFNRIYLFGCGTCATICSTGGEKEVKSLAASLAQKGKKVIGWTVIENPCDNRLVKKTLREQSKEIQTAEVAIVLSCGAGCANVFDNLAIPVIPGLDTLFLGKFKNLRNFEEGCSFCGACTLEATGGVCVITRCPKQLQNGPCGGSEEGRCEVNPEEDCVWTVIFEKLKKKNFKNLPEKILEIKKPRNFSRTIFTGKIKK